MYDCCVYAPLWNKYTVLYDGEVNLIKASLCKIAYHWRQNSFVYIVTVPAAYCLGFSGTGWLTSTVSSAV